MEQIKGKLFLLGAFSLAGTSVIVAHFVSGCLGTFTITTVSLFFALLVLLPLCGNNLVKTLRQMAASDWWMLLCQALCGIFLFRMFLLLGLMHTSTGEAGILTGATPAVTVIFARVLLKEAVNRKEFIGIVCTIAGILLLQGVLIPGSGFKIEHFLGNAFVLCSAVSESTFNIFSRINSLKKASGNTQAFKPVIQTTLVAGIAMLLCLIPSIFEHPVLSLVSLGIREWLALAWYGLFVTALAFIFWYAGIKRCEARTAAAFSGMMPFTSLTLSVLIFGEKMGWEQWCGGLLVISGMIIIGKCKSYG